MASALLKRVADCFDRLGIGRGAGIVAVSAGPDSVALFHLLRAVQVQKLIVAHVNHQLRGRESDEDEQFVKDLVNRFGGALEVVRFDTLQLAGKEGENLESCARRLRYQWLTNLAVRERAAWIATGHTADDQAETVLQRLL